eukprot:scaffold20039_cov49-Phaeocystis_antarctica.AAC.2
MWCFRRRPTPWRASPSCLLPRSAHPSALGSRVDAPLHAAAPAATCSRRPETPQAVGLPPLCDYHTSPLRVHPTATSATSTTPPLTAGACQFRALHHLSPVWSRCAPTQPCGGRRGGCANYTNNKELASQPGHWYV